MLRKTLLLITCIFLSVQIWSQGCPLTSLGQNPSTAFPVCGTDTFKQQTVPICSNGNIDVPGCAQSGALGGYQAKNPYWYRFTCFTTGTLGFVINPNNSGDDYDWQLYDITGHDPNDLFSQNLVVTGNWSGTYGNTGASATGVSFIQCASDPASNLSAFSAMPTIYQGHTYLLLVSHFTDTQSGYKLYFTGGTASITDPNIPKIKGADAVCDGVHMSVYLSKKMKCSTVDTDGSDFILSPNISQVISATGSSCNAGFDMDTVYLTLNNPLPPGKYLIKAKLGSDGNTILDNCSNAIAVGDSAAVTIYPFIPTPMDSIDYKKCNPKQIFLYFKKPIDCSSIDVDGSDFIITGPSAVNITKAMAISCVNNPQLKTTYTTGIVIDLSQAVFTGGTYQLKLVKGADGNTLIDECGMAVPLNSTLNFTVNQGVSAKFTPQIHYGCKQDTIFFNHDGLYGVNSWSWTFDSSTKKSSTQNNTLYYKIFGNKSASLVVTNGYCSDSSAVTYTLPTPNLKAAIAGSDAVCPNDTIQFKDASVGTPITWYWDFGNGIYSNAQNPPAQIYPVTGSTKEYPIRLEVTDTTGCVDIAYKLIRAISSCYIAVASAFTPNGDGLNDYLYPLNAYKATNLSFKVFNRFGQIIFQTTDWTKKWDGKINGIDQPAGTYVWTLDYTDSSTNAPVSLKGTVVLIR
jgi:gliding motility-associated-like protein